MSAPVKPGTAEAFAQVERVIMSARDVTDRAKHFRPFSEEDAFETMSAPEKPIPEIGALSAWQQEVATGTRSKYDIDALSRAACAEANAREWTYYPPVCNEYRRQAAELILGAFVLAEVA